MLRLAFLLCVCVLAYVWRVLAWARGTACVVRYTTLSDSAGSSYNCGCCGCCECLSAAAAVYSHGFWKSVSRRRQIINTKSNEWISRQSARFWTCRAAVRIYLGRALAFFFLCLFFAFTKTHNTIFFFVSVIWRFVAFQHGSALYVLQQQWKSCSVLQQYHMYCTAVLLTAVGRQMSGFEPSPPCFCVFFSIFFRSFFGWVSGVMGAWVMHCLQQQYESRWVSSSPLFSGSVFFFRFVSVLFLGWVRGVN